MGTCEDEVRQIEGLKAAGDKAALRRLLAATTDGAIRSNAIKALAVLRDTAGICEAFPCLDDWGKTTAIESLGVIGDRIAGPLLRELATDSTLDSYTRDALAKSLRAVGGDDAIEGLRRLLDCGDSLVIGTVITILSGMNDPKARELLQQHMQKRSR